MQREAKIYVLRDPRTNEARYVGKTVRDIRLRLREHLAGSLRKITYRDCWIANLVEEGCAPVIEQVELVSDDWEAREKYWISYFRENGERLTNLTDGGFGVPGLDPTVRSRQQARDKVTKASPEWRARQSAVIKASMTPVRRKQISEAQKIISADPAYKARLKQARERALSDPDERTRRVAALRASFTEERRATLSKSTKSIQTPEELARRAELKRLAWTPEMRAAASARVKANPPRQEWNDDRRRAQAERIRARNFARGAKNKVSDNEESSVSGAAAV